MLRMIFHEAITKDIATLDVLSPNVLYLCLRGSFLADRQDVDTGEGRTRSVERGLGRESCECDSRCIRYRLSYSYFDRVAAMLSKVMINAEELDCMQMILDH